jgi:hypothetical protein
MFSQLCAAVRSTIVMSNSTNAPAVCYQHTVETVSAKGARSGSEREADAEIAALSERISAL